MNWRFNTEAQANADNRPIYIPRGRVIGGSSSINGMVYMRGHRLDYDDWASAGNEGWSYREVLPYFLRSENNEEFSKTPYHHKGGPLTVSNCQNYTPLGELLFAAAQSLQLPLTSDFNGRDQEGFGRRQMTVKNGERKSAATAFLNPARSRPNLTILTDCVVDKVTIENRRATGVELLTSSGKRRLATRKEVIVSAGSIASPTLLQRSGVGSGAELRKHGIDVILDLPEVGQNLQDHLISSVQHRTESRVPYGMHVRQTPVGRMASHSIRTLPARPADKSDAARRRLRAHRPCTRPAEHSVSAASGQPFARRYDRYRSWLWTFRHASAPQKPGRGFNQEPRCICAPDNRSAFPRRPGRHETADARRQTRAPYSCSARVGFGAGSQTAPGVEVQTDDEICAYIRRICSTAFHPIGTCKMGKDEMAVVDPQLRVHGIAGLRVADASIMPTLIGGNTAAPTMMIGEKASDMILNKAPPPPSPGI